MFADQRIFCFCMVKSDGRRPAVRGMARLTVKTQVPPVTIRMARNASLIETEERLVRMLGQDLPDFSGLDVFVGVALFAVQRRVLS
jgi:hypothetical protein